MSVCDQLIEIGRKEEEMSGAGILNNLWGLGTQQEKGYRTGPPGYIGWRNGFLRIDSWAP
jgi:hypothetical protein